MSFRRVCLLFTAVFLGFASSSGFAATVSVDPETVSVATPTGVNPLPVRVPFNVSGANPANAAAVSDAAWVVPALDPVKGEVVLQFDSKKRSTGTHTATIRVTAGGASDSFFVKLTASSPNITRLLDDPFRSRVYGLQRDGTHPGALVVFDPISDTMLGSVSLGQNPTGFAISRDGAELFAINVNDRTISVVNLETLTVTKVLGPVPFGAWDSAVGTAEIAVGAGDILYYTDNSWAPVLRVYKQMSGQVLQAIDIKGNSVSGQASYNGDSGFGDFVISPDGRSLYAWAQYGWTAGLASSFLAQLTIAPDGRLTPNRATIPSWPDGLHRDPLDSPIFINSQGTLVFSKECVVSGQDVTTAHRTFPGTIRSVSLGGEIAANDNTIFDVVTGNPLFALPQPATVQTITSDYGRLVYFDGQTLKTVDLVKAIGDALPGQTTAPADGAIVLPPDRLEWPANAGVDRYHVYLGTSREAVGAATSASPEYLGETNGLSFALSTPLTPGTDYYWRVDRVLPQGTVRGAVQSFKVSNLSASRSKIETATLSGHSSQREAIELSSRSPAVRWTASADQSWVKFAAASGTTPSPLEPIFDASALAPGTHRAKILVHVDGIQQFELPVTLTVAPLRAKILRSDPSSSKVYGISEDSAAPARAYLFEFDADSETITRVVDVGTSATDLAVHFADGVIYVPNWMPGLLRSFDLKTFAPIRTFGFEPFSGTGYGEDDVYRVSPAGPGRLVIEEQDQWIDVSLFDTKSGVTIASTFAREGGGITTAGGRYYYHGDNNSSGAEIHRFDLSGNSFSALNSIRVESADYYGSRVVVASEDGARVFWNGSVFDAALTELWTIGELVYSTSPDGRLACGEKLIFDTTLKKAVLGMPAETTVSVFNGPTQKLVTQQGNRLRCDRIGLPYVMPAPQLTEVKVTASSAVLTWTEASLETGFTVQYRLADSASWSDTSPVTANHTETTIDGLLPGRSYEFRLKADSPIASSGWSNVLSAKIPARPPARPTLSIPAVNNGVVELNWSASEGATTYAVERKLTSGSTWLVLADVSAPALTFSDSSATLNVSYDYRVTAWREQIPSSPSNVRTITVLAPPPAPPRLEVFVRLDGSTVVVWDAVPTATSYILQRRRANSDKWVNVVVMRNGQTVFQDLTGSAEYVYRVAAANANGTSEFREPAPANPSPTPTPPATPRPTPKPQPTGDLRPPTIRLLGSRVRATNLNFSIIGGTAKDDRKLKSVEFQTSKGRVRTRAHGLKTWYLFLDLAPGENVVKVWATDAAGNRSRPVRVTVVRAGN